VPDKKPDKPDLPAKETSEELDVSAVANNQTAELKTAPELSKAYDLQGSVKSQTVSKQDDVVSRHEPVHQDLSSNTDSSAMAEPDNSTSLDDSETDKAVDDIAAKESDMLLAIDDARSARIEKSGQPKSWKNKLKNLTKNKRTWLAVAALLVVIVALPATRYPLLGLIIKKPVTITVLDSKTATPVSSALVQIAGDSVKTDADGRAHLKAAVGKHTLKITKQYYQSLNTLYFVGLKTAKQPTSISLIATGRLVPITVTNKITGLPLSGAEVSIKGTTAKTNTKGQATIALPTTASSYSAGLSLPGYNNAAVTVVVTDKTLPANSFELTPAGRIYFLSNLSGTIDVVKANLDGSGRTTVLAGTGKEDPNATSLLASRDWRFLVLKARRDSNQAGLYLIDTSSDKITQFDNSNSDFNLIGWYGHNFLYSLTNASLSNWQSSRVALKSYDADNLQLNLLDQNQAEGSSTSYAYQNFYNFYILNDQVVYTTQWYTFNTDGSVYNTTGKTDTIRAVQPNGQNKKDYQSFPAGTTGSIQASLYNPQAIYFSVYDTGTSTTSYYDYENQVAKSVAIDDSTFSQSYPTYLVSPSGNQTFWTELRDGKNSLFVGDSDAGSKKEIASLSDYSPYGWYSDSYVLVSKNSSELYIMPASGLRPGQQPLTITDYFKPAIAYNNYGYGYGGL